MEDEGPLVGAIDQGTSSSRFLVFDRECRVARQEGRRIEHQVEVKQSCPHDE
jgi:glycerol kinase